MESAEVLAPRNCEFNFFFSYFRGFVRFSIPITPITSSSTHMLVARAIACPEFPPEYPSTNDNVKLPPTRFCALVVLKR